MAYVDPITLAARGIELVPLALTHEAGLRAAAQDGELWRLRVYQNARNPDLEGDVQDVFFRSMRVEHGKLLIENENGERFEVDPKSRHVAGTGAAPRPASANRPCASASTRQAFRWCMPIWSAGRTSWCSMARRSSWTARARWCCAARNLVRP